MVRHTKAHRIKKSIDVLSASEKAIALGNAKADELAKQGAMDGPGFARDATLKAVAQQVQWALQTIGWWHVHFAKGWPDVTPRPPNAHPCHRRAREQNIITKHQLDRDLIVPEVLRCLVCRKWARSKAACQRLREERCRGPLVVSPATRGGTVVRWNGHLLFVLGKLWWCIRCAKWSQYVLRDLRGKHCVGQPVNPTQAARWRRLVAGKHPVTGLATGYEPRPLEMAEWQQSTQDEEFEHEAARAVDVAVELGDAGMEPRVLNLLGAQECAEDVVHVSDEDEVLVSLIDESDASQEM